MPLTSLITVLVVDSCAAQTVAGRALDANGDPIAYAILSYARGDVITRAITSESGAFEFGGDLVCDDDATLTAQSPTHEETVISCDELIADDNIIVLNQIKNYDVVIVNARKISRSFAPISLNRLEYLTNPTSKGDPLVAVSTLPFSTNTNESAEVVLRGSPAQASRIYLNDIPIYEAIRGSTFDRTTRGPSLLNTSVVGEVEIHPSNPPLFLGNASAGAVRLLPDDVFQGVNSLVLSTLVVGGQVGFQDEDIRHGVQIFGNYSDFDLSALINPNLADTVDSFKNVNIGGAAQIQTPGDGELRIFSMGDYETGVYPTQVFATRGNFENENTTSISTANLEYVIDKIRIKTDFGYTYAKSDQLFGSLEVENANQYIFASGDISGSAADDRLRYRTGVSHEFIDLQSVGQQPTRFFLFDENALVNATDVKQRIDQTSLYGYGLFSFGNGLATSAGVRQNFGGPTGDNLSFQGGLAYENDAHRVAIAAGRYHSFLLPESAFVGRTAGFRADQVAIDYSFRFLQGKITLGLFAKDEQTSDQTDLSERQVMGGEGAMAYSVTDALMINAAYTRAIVDEERSGQEFTGEDSVDFFVRTGATYNFNSAGQITINYVTRNGTRFTEIVDGTPIEQGMFFEPVFATAINGGQLRRYASLDLSYSVTVDFFPGDADPIFFISMVNLLDRKNPRGLGYSPDFSTSTEQTFTRRVLVSGLSFLF